MCLTKPPHSTSTPAPFSSTQVPEPDSPALFALGRIVATPNALDLLDRTAINGVELLQRHQHGDWGNVDEADAAENQRAVQESNRILSCYLLNDSERLWIITEADRSRTTLLLPEDY